jgi:glycosyltransferase involved in cell wall biosynthesis
VKSPMVSIVVPLYNKEKYILQCLLSIANQDFKDWECIIVDDGSTDKSIFLVEKFILQTPGNWKILSKQNGGPSSARNFGIQNSIGHFIAFIDSDDVWLPNKLSRQLEILLDAPTALMSLTDYVIVEEDGSKIKVVRNSKEPQLLGKWLNMRGFGGLVESTGLVRQSVFMADLFFDENLGTGEGLDFMLRVAQLGDFIVVPEFLTIYRLSEGQLHKNQEMIQRNSRILAQKFADSEVEFEKVNKLQNAYFELSSLRSLPKPKIVMFLLKRVAHFDFKTQAMAGSILFRNIKAKVVSRKTRSRIKFTMAQLTTRVVNLLP